MKFVTILTLSLIMTLISSFSFASDDVNESLNTLAVQNRQHSMTHEFSAFVGILPMDAFTKGMTVSGAYSLHFSDVVGWEVGQFTYSFGVDTKLREDLEALPQPAGPTPFEVVQYFVTSNLLFKPIYGKMAVLNHRVIYGEFFLALGGGYGWMTITGRPIADAGLGFRVYAGKYLSFRLDARNYMFINTEDIHNELWIGLGIDLSFD